MNNNSLCQCFIILAIYNQTQMKGLSSNPDLLKIYQRAVVRPPGGTLQVFSNFSTILTIVSSSPSLPTTSPVTGLIFFLTLFFFSFCPPSTGCSSPSSKFDFIL